MNPPGRRRKPLKTPADPERPSRDEWLILTDALRDPAPPVISPAADHVACKLALHGDWDGGAVWTSVRRLRRKTGRSKKAVLDALAELEMVGLLHRTEKYNERTGQLCFRLTADEGLYETVWLGRLAERNDWRKAASNRADKTSDSAASVGAEHDIVSAPCPGVSALAKGVSAPSPRVSAPTDALTPTRNPDNPADGIEEALNRLQAARADAKRTA